MRRPVLEEDNFGEDPGRVDWTDHRARITTRRWKTKLLISNVGGRNIGRVAGNFGENPNSRYINRSWALLAPQTTATPDKTIISDPSSNREPSPLWTARMFLRNRSEKHSDSTHIFLSADISFVRIINIFPRTLIFIYIYICGVWKSRCSKFLPVWFKSETIAFEKISNLRLEID